MIFKLCIAVTRLRAYKLISAQVWLKFFKEGECLNDVALPDWMSTQEMKQAMHTLSTFSEKDREYFQYQARQEYIRVQRAIQ